MKIELYAVLNSIPGRDDVPPLPPDLEFMLNFGKIQDFTENFVISVILSEELAHSFVLWYSAGVSEKLIEKSGRHEKNYKLIDLETRDLDILIQNSVRLEKIYELQDLETCDLVEVFPHWLGNPGRILNKQTALSLTHLCDKCERLDLVQLEDFKLKLIKKAGIQFTEEGEWIVSERLAGVFNKWGCSLRPTQNNGYFQLVSDHRIPLDVDRFPLSRGPYGCPTCRTRSINRFDGYEGSGYMQDAQSGPYIFQNLPVTVVDAGTKDAAFYRTEPDPTMISVSKKARFKIGSHSGFNDLYDSLCSEERIFVMKAPLVRELLELDTTGLRYRPVNVTAALSCPDWVDDGAVGHNVDWG